MSESLLIDVSIVTGANEALTFQCVDSLLDSTRGDPYRFQITVTCNTPGSSMGSRVRTRYPGLRVVENDQVLGFATNHNRVLRASGADYILVLNDDLIFRDGAVGATIRFLQQAENHDVGVLTPRLLNADGSIQPCTYSFPTLPRVLLDLSGLRDRVPTTRRLFWLARLLGQGNGRSRFWAHDRTQDVDTFAGAAMFVRGRALREVGVMDESTQVGGEEVEWHRRFRQRGWRAVFFADAELVHLGSQTVSRDPRLANEYFKGYLNYFRRHRGPVAYCTLLLGAVAVLGLRSGLARLRGDSELVSRAGLSLRTALGSLRALTPW